MSDEISLADDKILGMFFHQWRAAERVVAAMPCGADDSPEQAACPIGSRRP
jgi:hypothetical protein